MTQLPYDSVPLIDALRSGAMHDSDRSGESENCGDFGIRILRDGTWLYHGSPIGRKPLVRLFSSVLRREDGAFWLVTPVERGRIVVDDAPFTATEMSIEGAGVKQRITFRTNVDDLVTADAAHPIRVAVAAETGEPRPYIEVRDGLEALILRPLSYDLVQRGAPRTMHGANGDEERFGIWSAGVFFPLG